MKWTALFLAVLVGCAQTLQEQREAHAMHERTMADLERPIPPQEQRAIEWGDWFRFYVRQGYTGGEAEAKANQKMRELEAYRASGTFAK